METALLLLPDFSLILLGAAIRRWMHLGDHFWNGVEKLVYFILFPALLINSLVKAKLDLLSAFPLLATAFVAIVAMRVDARTRAAGELERFLDGVGLPVVAHLRDTQNYVQAAAHGLSIFELPPSRAEKDIAQWQPLLDWVQRPV